MNRQLRLALTLVTSAAVVGGMLVSSAEAATPRRDKDGVCREGNLGTCYKFIKYENCGELLIDWGGGIAKSFKIAEKFYRKGYNLMESPVGYEPFEVRRFKKVMRLNKHLDPERNGAICEHRLGDAPVVDPGVANLKAERTSSRVTLTWDAARADVAEQLPRDFQWEVTHDGYQTDVWDKRILLPGIWDGSGFWVGDDLTPGTTYTYSVRAIFNPLDVRKGATPIYGAPATITFTFEDKYQEATKTSWPTDWPGRSPEVLYLSNCAAARDAGQRGMKKGSEWYDENWSHLDFDNDGIACE